MRDIGYSTLSFTVWPIINRKYRLNSIIQKVTGDYKRDIVTCWIDEKTMISFIYFTLHLPVPA